MSATRIFVCILTIILVFIIIGCSKDKSTEPPIIPPALVDTWIYQSATVGGIPFHPGFLLGWQPSTATARFTVNEDGTYTYEELDSSDVVIWIESGTADVDGGNAVIIITDNSDGPVEPPEVFAATWIVFEDELTLTTIIDDATVVFVAIRQNLG